MLDGNMEEQTERYPIIRVKKGKHLLATSGHGDLILGRPAKVDSKDQQNGEIGPEQAEKTPKDVIKSEYTSDKSGLHLRWPPCAALLPYSLECHDLITIRDGQVTGTRKKVAAMKR